MQSDLFGSVAPEQPVTRKGFPIEAAIAKRYPRTLCYCCEQPIEWFRHAELPRKLGQGWICGPCLIRYHGLSGELMLTLQQQGKPIYAETESETGEGRGSVPSDSGTSSEPTEDGYYHYRDRLDD